MSEDGKKSLKCKYCDNVEAQQTGVVSEDKPQGNTQVVKMCTSCVGVQRAGKHFEPGI